MRDLLQFFLLYDIFFCRKPDGPGPMLLTQDKNPWSNQALRQSADTKKLQDRIANVKTAVKGYYENEPSFTQQMEL